MIKWSTVIRKENRRSKNLLLSAGLGALLELGYLEPARGSPGVEHLGPRALLDTPHQCLDRLDRDVLGANLKTGPGESLPQAFANACCLDLVQLDSVQAEPLERLKVGQKHLDEAVLHPSLFRAVRHQESGRLQEPERVAVSQVFADLAQSALAVFKAYSPEVYPKRLQALEVCGEAAEELHQDAVVDEE